MVHEGHTPTVLATILQGHRTGATGASSRSTIASLLGVLALLAIGVVWIRRLPSDPAFSILSQEEGAHWIRYPDPFSYMGRPRSQEVTTFRRRFDTPGVAQHAQLVVRGFKRAVVLLDGVSLPAPTYDPEHWNRPMTMDLGPSLGGGSHVLMISVLNWNGHAAALAHCGALGLRTDDSWEASHDSVHWAHARSIDEPEALSLPEHLPTTGEAFVHQLWWILPAMLAAFAWTVLRARGRFQRMSLTPPRLRWILIAAWLALACNNMFKIPLEQGFDLSGHMDYVRHILANGRLPIASDGWEMYQAPFYYLLTAGLLWMTASEHLLRILPLACGILQVEVVFRTVRLAFPEEENLQLAGLWIAGLLPVNIYISQVVGNEPFCGLATSLLGYLCLKALLRARDLGSIGLPLRIGVVLGIALLSKVSAILWIPLSGVALVWSSSIRGDSKLRALRDVVIAWGTAGLFAGWFYARNWVLLGKPIIGQWDWKETNQVWWQDPGYRVPEHFLRFGRALVQPVYSAIDGYWDGLYSTLWTEGLWSGLFVPPPWHMESMIAEAWLGVPVTVAVIAAILSSFWRTDQLRPVVRFATLAVGLYVAAALYLYLRLPVYSIGKASHALGLLPLFAVLAAAGLTPLIQRTASRALVNGYLLCLGVAAYVAYFVS